MLTKGRNVREIKTALEKDDTVAFDKSDLDWDFFDAMVYMGRIAQDYLISDDEVVARRGPSFKVKT